MHLMIHGECEKCEDRGEIHGPRCIVRKLIFDRDFKDMRPHVTREDALDAALRSLEGYLNKERERKQMSENQTQIVNQAKPKMKLDLSEVDNFMLRADINSMNELQIDNYIRKLCELVAMNPITRPFDIMIQGGKKVIYANKGCAEQLRNIWGISIRIVKREVIEGVYTVTVAAQMGDNRVDESTGCVWIEGLKGEARANAMMKAETKGKRRVTLSICGLNMPDDSEVDSIPGATRQGMDSEQSKQVSDDAPICCGEKMSISKYPDKLSGKIPFWCRSCKNKAFPEKKIDSVQSEQFIEEEMIDLTDSNEELQVVSNNSEVPWAKYRSDARIVK